MPYRITWELSGVYRSYFGKITDRGRKQSLQKICRDARFSSLSYVLTDFLSVTEFLETDQATLQLAALNVSPLLTNPGIVLAAVAHDPQHLAYIQRVRRYGLLQVPYESFPDLASARQWIAERTGIEVQRQCEAMALGTGMKPTACPAGGPAGTARAWP